MALIELYNRSIFKKLKTTDSPEFPIPVATEMSNPPVTDTTVIKSLADTYYENAPVLQTTYLGSAAQPLITIKPNDSADEYSNKLNYTLTRAGATARWLLSPEGLKFGLNQGILQIMNPTIETKIWKPNSILSNLIPLTGYHERRHMDASNLFGIPGLSIITGAAPATYTEALYSNDIKSRAYYQSPIRDTKGSEFPGILFAQAGAYTMGMAKTWKSLDPNKYGFPIGADGGGLPNSNRLSPFDHMNINKALAEKGWRYTLGTGYTPVSDAQITMNNQLTGTSFLQNLLRKIPFANTVMAIFGYGILGSEATKIKIFNKYNVTYSYSAKKGKQIRVVNNDGEELDTYDVQAGESPLERLLYAITEGTAIGGEKAQTGTTFANKAAIPGYDQYAQASLYDSRLTKNPQDSSNKLNSYLQTYGDIVIRRGSATAGSLNIDNLLDEPKTYSQHLKDSGVSMILSPQGRGFADSGNKVDKDRKGDSFNLLEYGEEKPTDGSQDLIPFKFYHINKRKWIVFRANLNGITDNVSPEWNEKAYIGRADKLYIYKGATRKVNFSFSLMIHNPKELQPVYEKLNYLMGLSYPTYKDLSEGYGKYMEAPFVKLTIGGLFNNVAGILDGGVTVTFDDDMTWEVRDEQPKSRFDTENIKIAKLPRLIRVTIGSFTPFSLDHRPMSSTSPFYSAIKDWQKSTV